MGYEKENEVTLQKMVGGVNEFAEYLVEVPGHPGINYKFPNLYGASVIQTRGWIELAVVWFGHSIEGLPGGLIMYDTPVVEHEVEVVENSEGLGKLLTEIYNLPEREDC
ncbi:MULTISPECIES: hypothetical protein [Bacillus amyloliquefaciens group]|uniref:hypothetical protein n=1 Tax=Bacillus amyloliquefaciens group TaxID=1938374 RepID=UPI00073AFE69|nr:MULTISPECIES: hypothetical protein [Bacillus amyloliquefaciens group]KTF59816.1 hypothetical protein AR691_13865 [Bacillus amyloliquefaciens]